MSLQEKITSSLKSGEAYIASLFAWNEKFKENPSDVPPRINSKGHICPADTLDPIEAAEDDLVNAMVDIYLEEREILRDIKLKSFKNIEDFISFAFKHYNVKRGGKKNNVMLINLRQTRKVELTYAAYITTSVEMLLAKELIDQIITEESAHLNEVTKKLIKSSFYLKNGDISLSGLITLSRENIPHPKWHDVQKYLAKALKPVGKKAYIRVYQRESSKEKTWEHITLDIASL